ncbi:integrase catalytic domain-containing protein [Trichonephila clavipes]|nr:integrase catalytic domain-containing protein [Trichonephila clavipes]
MKIGNNGNLVLVPFDESTPCLMIVLMNCQTKLRINHLITVKSVAILETEILALKQNEQLRSSSEIKSSVPYLDENNLLRLTGRLLEADLCFCEKNPVILPRRCKFTELLVIREHERIGHCGVSATLTQLRKNIGYLRVVS